MAITEQQRHQMIERAVFNLPAPDAEVSVKLWENLAAELSVIIGERGFESLYSRSLYRTGGQYSWLARHPPQATADGFKLLASSLKMREPAEAQAASAALLNIFIDTLIILIGELLTNSILRSAWGDDVVNDAGTEHRT